MVRCVTQAKGYMSFFRSVGQWFLRSFAIGPLEMAICVLLFGASVVCEYDQSLLSWSQWRSMFLGAAIAVPLSFAASYLAHTERLGGGPRWAIQMVALCLGAYVAIAADYDIMAWVYVTASLIVASIGVLLVAPGLHGANDEQLGSYVISLLGRAALGGLYALLLFLGLAGALWAFSALFDVRVDSLIQHLLALAGIFLFPALVIGASQEIWEAEKRGFSGDARLERATASYLFAPLMIAYIAILYLYLTKVVVTGEWPSNVVSPLVLGAATMGFAGQVVLGSVWARPEEQPGLAKLFRGFSFVMVIPIMLGFVAITMRLRQYGVTPTRYFVVVLLALTALLVLFDIFRSIRKRPPSIRALVALTTVAALLLGVGPLSAANVSFRSQLPRVQAMIENTESLKDGQWSDAKALDIRLREKQHVAVDDDVDYIGNDYLESEEYQLVRGLHELRSLVGPARVAKALDVSVEEVDAVVALRQLMWNQGVYELDGEVFREDYRASSGRRAVRMSDGRWFVRSEHYMRGARYTVAFDGCEALTLYWNDKSGEIEFLVGEEVIYHSGDLKDGVLDHRAKERAEVVAEALANPDADAQFAADVYPMSNYHPQNVASGGVDAIWLGYGASVRMETEQTEAIISGQVAWVIDGALMAPYCQVMPLEDAPAELDTTGDAEPHREPGATDVPEEVDAE